MHDPSSTDSTAFQLKAQNGATRGPLIPDAGRGKTGLSREEGLEAIPNVWKPIPVYLYHMGIKSKSSSLPSKF